MRKHPIAALPYAILGVATIASFFVAQCFAWCPACAQDLDRLALRCPVCAAWLQPPRWLKLRICSSCGEHLLQVNGQRGYRVSHCTNCGIRVTDKPF